MGITGLFSILKDISRPVHIREYAGKTVAVDVASWLFRGLYSCAMQVEMDPRVDWYVGFCMERVSMLQRCGVKPFLVFDGQSLPMKAATMDIRTARREEMREQARKLHAAGNDAEAEKAFKRCMYVNEDMQRRLITACREYSINYVVAPYEADAQLAFLSRRGIADAVITDDSDLLVFGAHDVLFKMDAAGHAVSVQRARLQDIMVSVGKSVFNLEGFSEERFRHMCILGGCDYLPASSAESHIMGVGIKTAAKFMALHGTVDRAISLLEAKKLAPKGYAELVNKASMTFAHQVVFDPTSQEQIPLNPYPEGVDPKDLQFAGTIAPKDKAILLSKGDIRPSNGERYTGTHLSHGTTKTLLRVMGGARGGFTSKGAGASEQKDAGAAASIDETHVPDDALGGEAAALEFAAIAHEAGFDVDDGDDITRAAAASHGRRHSHKASAHSFSLTSAASSSSSAAASAHSSASRAPRPVTLQALWAKAKSKNESGPPAKTQSAPCISTTDLRHIVMEVSQSLDSALESEGARSAAQTTDSILTSRQLSSNPFARRDLASASSGVGSLPSTVNLTPVAVANLARLEAAQKRLLLSETETETEDLMIQRLIENGSFDVVAAEEAEAETKAGTDKIISTTAHQTSKKSKASAAPKRKSDRGAPRLGDFMPKAKVARPPSSHTLIEIDDDSSRLAQVDACLAPPASLTSHAQASSVRQGDTVDVQQPSLSDKKRQMAAAFIAKALGNGDRGGDSPAPQ